MSIGLYVDSGYSDAGYVDGDAMSIGLYVDSGYSDAGYVDGDATSTIARPTSDISNTGWTPSTGSDLYAMLDEVSPDDADYISTSTLGATCKMSLNATQFPGGASQQLSLRASSSTGNGILVTIKDGPTTIATRSLTLTPTFDLHTITMTSGENRCNHVGKSHCRNDFNVGL